MKTPEEIILEELGGVEAVVRFACDIEAVRRGTSIDRHDQQVQLLAAELILNGVGEEMRKRHNAT